MFRVFALTLQLLAHDSAGKSTPAFDPVGLWAAGTVNRVVVGGTIAVQGLGSDLRASIGGTSLSAVMSGTDTLVARFGSERGEFHGRFTARRDELRGFWMQPPLRGDTHASATPVYLRRVALDRWEGELRPLSDLSAIFLQLRRDRGALVALLRNVDTQVDDGRFTVYQAGNALTFREMQGRRRLSATLVPRDNRLKLVAPLSVSRSGQSEWLMARRSRIRASGFFPRPDSLPYEYRAPLVRNDGWLVQDARARKWDAAALAALVQSILTVDPATSGEPRVMSIAVAQHGRLVLDEYFYGQLPDAPGRSRLADRLLSGSLRTASPLRFDDSIARPLQFAQYAVPVTRRGTLDSTGTRIRPRDLLKIAQIRLGHGKWNGRVIPSALSQVTWTRRRLTTASETFDADVIVGNGEMLVVVPRLDVAAVITARPTGNTDSWRRYADRLISAHLLPAASASGRVGQAGE